MRLLFAGEKKQIEKLQRHVETALANMMADIIFLDRLSIDESMLIKTDILYTLSYEDFNWIFKKFERYVADKYIIAIVDNLEGEKVTSLLRKGVHDIVYSEKINDDLRSISYNAMYRVQLSKESSFNKKYLVREEKQFILDNDLNAVTPVVHQMLQSSRDLFKSSNLIEVALYESIYNAIEHGNLEIDFETKESLIEDGVYEKYVAERTMSEPYKSRRVKIKSTMDQVKLIFVITDSGNGFDWRKQYDRINSDELYLGVNGRGMKIMVAIFDKVFYNDKGNEVTLVIKRDIEKSGGN